MKKKIGRYFYKDIGLTNVYIENIPVYSCPCGTDIASIFQVGKLNNLIAKELLKKPALLDGAEIRFLRKNLRLPAKTFAQKMGVAVTTYSKWENDRQVHRETNDRLVRTTYMIIKAMAPSESKYIIDQLSGKKLNSEHVDPLIVAKRIDDTYVLFREQLQTSSACALNEFCTLIFNNNLTATSPTLTSNRQSATNEIETGTIRRSAQSNQSVMISADKAGTC